MKSGGKISNDDLHHFINASYSNGKDYKNWKLDHSLSDASVQVYFNGHDAVVVHRGSQDAQDWKENALTAIGIKSGQKRLEHSRKIQKKAEAKYGAKNVITIGHSKGAYHAEEVGQNSREIYTLNKPVTPYDLLYKKVPSHQTDIRSGLDPVSILRPLQRGNEHENILSRTLNPLTEHLGSVLNRVNPSKWWGRGGRCWKGYEPVPGRKPYSKGSCRKTGGIVRTEAQFRLAVSVLKRLLQERHLLDEEKNQLEETFDEVKDFIQERFYDLDYPDAMKLLVVLNLMIKKKIMTKKAQNILNEYFAEDQEERYSDDFETFDEKTGKGRRRRKSGAGSGASILSPVNSSILNNGRTIIIALRFLNNTHFNDQLALTDIQLVITKMMLDMINFRPLRHTDIHYIISIIDKILENPICSISFKRKFEPIKRQLVLAFDVPELELDLPELVIPEVEGSGMNGAGSGSSVLKPPSGSQIPEERVEERREVNEPINFSRDVEELELLASQIMDYIEGNKALTQPRKEWFEKTIPKIKHLLLKLPQEEDDFFLNEEFFDNLKEILLIVKPRKKMGNQLRDQIDEILSILNQFKLESYGDFEGAGLSGGKPCYDNTAVHPELPVAERFELDLDRIVRFFDTHPFFLTDNQEDEVLRTLNRIVEMINNELHFIPIGELRRFLEFLIRHINTNQYLPSQTRNQAVETSNIIRAMIRREDDTRDESKKNYLDEDEEGGSMSGGSIWSRLLNCLRPGSRVHIDERTEREIVEDFLNEINNFRIESHGYYGTRDVSKVRRHINQLKEDFQTFNQEQRFLFFSLIRIIINNPHFPNYYRQDLGSYYQVMYETDRIPFQGEELTPRNLTPRDVNVNMSGRGREFGLSCV